MFWNGKGSLKIGKKYFRKGDPIPSNLLNQITDRVAKEQLVESIVVESPLLSAKKKKKKRVD